MTSAPAPPVAATNANCASVGVPTFTPVKEHAIKIGKTLTLSQESSPPAEIFSMTLGQETIALLPLRNWEQLDIHKWCARGKLPGMPAGLEITLDHIKILGESVSATEPNACQRLEELFNQWLALEKSSLEQARHKTHPKSVSAPQSIVARSQPEPLRFHVEADKRGQVHIQCVQGKEVVASIGLSVAGLNSLVNQGLMRKPATMKVGALHDWVELDGTLCSFETGYEDRDKLDQLLNSKYLPTAGLGQGKNIVIFTNAASSTGFDIQFPVTVAGLSETRRRHLAEDALEVLQDPQRCGLLQPGRIVKLTRPCLIFKEKTPDGGERYLEKRPENIVRVQGDDGVQMEIDLSRPVNYMHLSAMELTAVFNHPVVNRHGNYSSASSDALVGQPISTSPPPNAEQPPAAVRVPTPVASEVHPAVVQPPVVEVQKAPIEVTSEEVHSAVAVEKTGEPESMVAESIGSPPILPNQWLKNILAQTPLRHEWLASLLYTTLARHFGNSREGTFGASACWASALGPTKHIEDPAFKGIFLTEKRGLGFLNHGHLARFNKGVAFLGTQDFALEGIGINLIGVGLETQGHVVFVVNDGYRAQFGVPEQTVTGTLVRFSERGAVVMSIQEVMNSGEPLEVVWTAPEQQQNPGEPQVLESLRPGSTEDTLNK